MREEGDYDLLPVEFFSACADDRWVLFVVYAGAETTTGAAGYSCVNNSPCTQGVGYYPHANVAKYILCDYDSGCLEHDCATGMQWVQSLQTLDRVIRAGQFGYKTPNIALRYREGVGP